MLFAPWEHAGEPLVGATSKNWVGSVPVSVIDVMFSGAVPELVSCILLVADASPTFTSPKAKVV